MQSIIGQQIELELGDEYSEALDRARQYVGKTMNMYYRWGKASRILDNEGGRTGVLTNCLATIIETGDIDTGLDRWSTYIAEEYANGAHNKWVDYSPFFDDSEKGAPISKEIDVRPEEGYTTLGYSPASSSDDESSSFRSFGSDAFVVSDEHSSNGFRDDERADAISKVIKNSQELELYRALSHTQNLQEAAQLIGIDYETAKRLNNRVWQRVRYHYGTRGYRMSSMNG